MPRPRPFLFCRYTMLISEEALDGRAQLTVLNDLQGQFFGHGPKAEREGRQDIVLMRPRRLQIDGEEAISWSVGQQIETRVAAKYDKTSDRIQLVSIDDGTVRYNDIVALPRLNVLAVDDRSGERHLGAKGAISRFRSIFRNVDENASANIYMMIDADDMDHALRDWELEEVAFKVRPINPHSSQELSRKLSDAMKRENIGTFRATVRPAANEDMRPNEGPIDQASALSRDGYGQIGVRGKTPEGHMAKIPRPQFELEKSKNQKIQSKPRELRVYIESDEESDDKFAEAVVKALVSFYDR